MLRFRQNHVGKRPLDGGQLPRLINLRIRKEEKERSPLSSDLLSNLRGHQCSALRQDREASRAAKDYWFGRADRYHLESQKIITQTEADLHRSYVRSYTLSAQIADPSSDAYSFIGKLAAFDMDTRGVRLIGMDDKGIQECA